MTTSTEPVVSPSDGAPTDLTPGSRFRRIGGGLSLIASGTLVFVSLLMIPYENQTDAAYLQTGVDHKSNILWAMPVLHYGFLLLLPAALTLVQAWIPSNESSPKHATRSTPCVERTRPFSKTEGPALCPARSTGGGSPRPSPTTAPRHACWACRGGPEPGSRKRGLRRASCSALKSETTASLGSATSP